MKFYHEYAIIAYLIIGAFNQVQGINAQQYLRMKKKKSAQGIGEFVKDIRTESGDSNLKYALTNLPTADLREITLEEIAAHNNSNSSITRRKQTTKETTNLLRKKLYTRRNHLQASAKSYRLSKPSYSEINAKENLNSNHHLPIQVSFRGQKVYCRQEMKRAPDDEQGLNADSIQHICAPLPIVSVTLKPSISSTRRPFSGTKKKHFWDIVSSTPKGINCRRVMNSEFNELGEIVDSVTEVCDPPTTTTTTTPKPTPPKVTTTTAKPLIKICRPVMDSYLNEEGKIIDSVTMVCRMEPIN